MDGAAVDELRAELQSQLSEQRQSLADIDEALAAGDSAELQQLREDLLEAIQQLEEALGSIQADSPKAASDSLPAKDPRDQRHGASASTCQDSRLTVGSACR